MEIEKIKEIEDLVDEMGDCYDYPEEEKVKYYIWNAKSSLEEVMADITKTNEETNILEETHLFFRLGRYREDKKRFEKFNNLPMEEIYQWFQENFSQWEQEISENETDRTMTLSFKVDYGIERNILLFPYEEKCLGITLTNVEEKDIKMLLAYLKPLVTDIYQQN